MREKDHANVTVTRYTHVATVHHTRGGTLPEGRGTGFRDTRSRVSAAVAVARAAVPNFIDDGAGAFEHEARASADLPLLFVAGR